MAMIEQSNIDKGIPVPEKKTKTPKYPWREMSVGDSFFTEKPITKIASVATTYARRHQTKYTARSVTERGVRGTRIWRTA